MLRKILESDYHNISLWYFFSFTIGIIVFFSYQQNISINITALLIVIILVPIYFCNKFNRISEYFILCCFAMFLIGILASQYRLNSIKVAPIEKEQIVDIRGKILSVQPNLRGQQVTIGEINSRQNSDLDKVRINFNRKTNSDFHKGQIVKFRAKIFPPMSNILPYGFDFGFYLKTDGVQATGYALTKPEIIMQDDSSFTAKISALRQYIYQKLLSALGADKGNFAAAILIGQTKAMPTNIADNMRDTGVAHILSISGLHLSLVAMIFFTTSRALLNCSNFLAYNFNLKIIAAMISIIGSFFYLQISGNNIAAMRAFIMTSIFMIAISVGRSAYSIRSVVLAAFVILLFLPEYILHPSFQLSFTAVMCLISGHNFYDSDLLKTPQTGAWGRGKMYVLTNIHTSLLASVVTAPYVIFHFYKFANYSVLMNLIAVPLMSFFIMPLGLLSLFILPFSIGDLVLKLMGWFIGIILDSGEYIASLPFAVWQFGYISPKSLMLFNLGFCWLCFWQNYVKYVGTIFMVLSFFLMKASTTPDIIINQQYQILSIKDDQALLVYSPKKLSDFTKNYLTSWYGVDAIKVFQANLFTDDLVINLPNHRIISFNRNYCTSADFMIITNHNLNCGQGKNIIYMHEQKQLIEL